jgi:hypothetical protein
VYHASAPPSGLYSKYYERSHSYNHPAHSFHPAQQLKSVSPVSGDMRGRSGTDAESRPRVSRSFTFLAGKNHFCGGNKFTFLAGKEIFFGEKNSLFWREKFSLFLSSVFCFVAVMWLAALQNMLLIGSEANLTAAAVTNAILAL